MPRNGSLLFSIEQWELIRRLRNSGLTKEQIGQAFDDLAKIEQDLGSMYDMPINSVQTNDAAKFPNNQLLSNMQIFQMAKNLSSMTQGRSNGNSTQSNGFNSLTNGNSLNHNNNNNNSNNSNSIKREPNNDQTSPTFDHAENNSNHPPSNSATNGSSHASSQNNLTTAATTIVNNHFASMMDPEQELKQIEEFKLKGEVVIHGEISFFVYKHDLKQSQIARMAGVNQAYVSKFLRGEFFDLSENGKSLIYKWYLRFLKNPQIYQQAHNLSINPNLTASSAPSGVADKAGLASLPNHLKGEQNSGFNNVTNTSYDAPKRSRFSFKSEHLVILEKAFIENHYPDQKKREELTKQCNEAKPCSERVTEQIVQHWFQNKRKITRKNNADDQTSISPSNNINGISNSHVYNDDYRGDDSFNDEYRNNDSNGESQNGNIDYQNESLIDYQDFIEDDSDFRNILDQPNNRKRSADAIDY